MNFDVINDTRRRYRIGDCLPKFKRIKRLMTLCGKFFILLCLIMQIVSGINQILCYLSFCNLFRES